MYKKNLSGKMLLLNPNVRFMKGLGVRVEPMIS